MYSNINNNESRTPTTKRFRTMQNYQTVILPETLYAAEWLDLIKSEPGQQAGTNRNNNTRIPTKEGWIPQKEKQPRILPQNRKDPRDHATKQIRILGLHLKNRPTVTEQLDNKVLLDQENIFIRQCGACMILMLVLKILCKCKIKICYF